MVSRIVDRCRQQAGRAADFMLRRHARASRWAEQALPERRLHWHGTRLSECAVKLEKRFLHISVGLENLAGRSDLLLESSRRLLKYSLGHEGGASTFGSAVAAMERPLTFYNECLVITNKVDHNLGLVAGRIGLDYMSLLAALHATGARPNPSLVLLAYAATAVIALIPITPGGIGIVEASLSGLLVLANVPSSSAVLATLVFRLGSYWLPTIAGGVCYILFRRRYGSMRHSDTPS